ncbi:hypothetical protein ACWGK1_36995 [Streptomyces wedmorensis]
MTHTLDSARTQLLVRLEALPRFRKNGPEVLARRIARMTDRQVAAVLAMADEELHAEPARIPQYAPATDDTPVILYHHVDGG